MTEHQEQAALVKLCALNAYKYPELDLLFAIPNGGLRDKITAARLQAEGVKPGVPDLFLPVPRGSAHGLFVEMKTRIGGRLSYAQKAKIFKLKHMGYVCVVAYGWEEAWNEIRQYLGIEEARGRKKAGGRGNKGGDDD